MPRGVKRTPELIEEQIKEIQTKIKVYQARISKLNAKKKALQQTKEKAEKDTLYQLVKNSGQSASDLIKKLSE